MAAAPNGGISFEIQGRWCVLGTLRGEEDLVVLAIEKSSGTGDYAWEYAELSDHLMHTHGDDITAALYEIRTKANEALVRVFGNEEPAVETYLERIEQAIVNGIAFNSTTNQLVPR